MGYIDKTNLVMAKKLQSNFIRRIEKTLTSVRPQIPVSGTNHVDDPTLWTSNMLYQGELGINYNCGKLWTQDGETGVQPNTEDAILEGLVLSNVGVSGTYLAVSEGYARFKGRTYVYSTPSLSNPSTIAIESSTGAAGPRIDTIVASPSTTYNSVEDLYELEISVIKGDVFAPGCSATKLWPAQVPEPNANCEGGYFLLGFVYVPANLNQATTPLYPLAAVDATVNPATAQPYDPDNIGGNGYYVTFPFPIMTTNDLIRRRQRTNFEWQPNTLYFEKQLVYIISSGCGTLYEVSETYQSSSSSATDISAGYLVEFCGAGGASTTIDTFADIGYPPSAGVPTFSEGYFSDWDSTTRIIDSIAYLNSLIGKLAPTSPKPIDQITLVLSQDMNAFSAKTLTGSIVTNVIDDNSTPAVAMTPNGEPFKDYNNHCEMFGFFGTTSVSSGIIYDDDPGFDLPEVPTYYTVSTTSIATAGSMQIKVSSGDIANNPMLMAGRNLLIREISDPTNYFYVVVKDNATWSSGTLTIQINDNTSFSSISSEFDSWEIYIANVVDIASPNVVLNAAKVDPYENIDQKDDIYTAFSASVETAASIAASTTKRVLGINYKGVQGTCDFYVEDLITPIISMNAGPQGIHAAGKYLSGVPVLSTGDTLKMSYEVEDAVSYFYNKDRIVDCLNTVDFDPYVITDQDVGIPLPWTAGQLIVFTDDNSLTVSDEACSDGLSFNLAAYNSRGTEVSDVGTLLLNTDIVADSNSIEIPPQIPPDSPGIGRFSSGTGLYPSGIPIFDGGASWGEQYNTTLSQEDLTLNEELQLGPTQTNSGQVLCGYYFFPSEDYSTMNIVDGSGTPITGPDYTTIPNTATNDYRWVTLYAGYIDDPVKYARLRIIGGENILEDWNGLVMTPNFQFQVKIYDPDATPSAFMSGWLDGNTAYDSSAATDPINDGDAALDASFSQGPLFRRITFGQTARRGQVWVRIGVKYYDEASLLIPEEVLTNIRFRGVSLIDSNSAVDGDEWTYIDNVMPTLSSIQYLTLALNATGLPAAFSDQDSPNTMTPGLELQVRLNGASGTDWVSANDAYDPGIVPEPYNLGDPALDASMSTLTNRRVTFGSIIGGRSGVLEIRYRIAPNSPIVINTITLEDYS